MRCTTNLVLADHWVSGLNGDPARWAGFSFELIFDDFRFDFGQFADPCEAKPGRFEEVAAALADVLLEHDLNGLRDLFRVGFAFVFECSNTRFATGRARILFGLVATEWCG